MLFNRCLSVGGVVKLCNNYLSPTAAAASVVCLYVQPTAGRVELGMNQDEV